MCGLTLRDTVRFLCSGGMGGRPILAGLSTMLVAPLCRGLFVRPVGSDTSPTRISDTLPEVMPHRPPETASPLVCAGRPVG